MRSPANLRSYLKWARSSVKNSKWTAVTRPAVIVTGADSSHFLSLVQLLETVERVESKSDVVVWDLGLTSDEALEVRTRFPRVIVRRFRYEQYPSFFNIRIEAGEYAWKPTVILDTWVRYMAEDDHKILIWCDAGNFLFRRLNWVRRYAARHGVHTKFSGGTLREWTHPGTLEHFDLNEEDLGRRNAHGALVAFDFRHSVAKSTLQTWAEYALRREVIAPSGSDRTNHRQDQALLGCILAQNKVLEDSPYRTKWNSEYKTHCDVEAKAGLNQRFNSSGKHI